LVESRRNWTWNISSKETFRGEIFSINFASRRTMFRDPNQKKTSVKYRAKLPDKIEPARLRLCAAKMAKFVETGGIIKCTVFLRESFAKFVKTVCAIFSVIHLCCAREDIFVGTVVVVCCDFASWRMCCLCMTLLVKQRIRYIRLLRRKELLLRRTGNQCHLRRKCVDR
jgi:hypothetical protein